MKRLALLLLTLAVAAPAAAQAPPPQEQPPPPEQRAPAGVSAAGVDLSNLTIDEARVKLELTVGQALAQDVILGAAGVPWTLHVADAKFVFDAVTTAKRAVYAKAGTVEVPLAVKFSKRALRNWMAGVAKKVYRAPRDATLKIGLRKQKYRRAKHGKALDRAAVEKLIGETLVNPAANRRLHSRLKRVSPNVSVNDLRRRYETIITISKGEFKLRLFRRLKFVKSYGVAYGQPAYPTPEGLFNIQSKQVNPVWSVPNSPWAGELAGTTVEGGTAANPLKARWMGIANGVGIHGTGEDYSIGTRASHGCIRMHVWDVVDLYDRVRLGTPVLIR